LSYIRVDSRKVGFAGKSLSVTIPSTFVEFEQIERHQTWHFLYSLGGHTMIFTRECDLHILREELKELLELVDYKIEKGLTEPLGGYF